MQHEFFIVNKLIYNVFMVSLQNLIVVKQIFLPIGEYIPLGHLNNFSINLFLI